MLRDDQIASIKSHLDALMGEEKDSLKYEAIMSLANHRMNLNIFVDDTGKHQVLWTNRHLKTYSTFDDDVKNLLEYIEKLCSYNGEKNNEQYSDES